MFLCFRMMRHSDMPADRHAESDDVDSLRKEVADLREELAGARSAPSDAAAADGMQRIFRRGASETASDSQPLSPPTPAGAAGPAVVLAVVEQPGSPGQPAAATGYLAPVHQAERQPKRATSSSLGVAPAQELVVRARPDMLAVRVPADQVRGVARSSRSSGSSGGS
jgi:hypothetical protein